MKLDNITIVKLINVFKQYLIEKKNNNFNLIILRITMTLTKTNEQTNNYEVCLPEKYDINDVITCFSNYIIDNLTNNYDVNKLITLTSIDIFRTNKSYDDIKIACIKNTITQENFIRKLCVDIIDQMNKHLFEQYMEENYNYIDIYDENDKEMYIDIINNISMKDVYDKYKFVTIYVPIDVMNKDIRFFINGHISITSTAITIMKDIRECLENNIEDEFNYDKSEIIYKFTNSNIKIKFDIISDMMEI